MYIAIRHKLAILLSTISAVSIIISGFIIYGIAKDQLAENLDSLLYARIAAIEDNLTVTLDEQLNHVIGFAEHEPIIPFIDALVSAGVAKTFLTHPREVIAKTLSVLTNDHGRFRKFWVLNAIDGEIIASTEPEDVGKSRTRESYFTKGRDAPHVESPFLNLAEHTPVLFISAPILSDDGELLAVLVGQLDLRHLQSALTIGKRSYRSLDVFLINATNFFLTQPRFIEDDVVLMRQLSTNTADLCRKQHEGMITTKDYRSVDVISAFKWLPNYEMCLIAEIDFTEANEPVILVRNTVFVSAFLGAILAVVASSLIAARFTRPITDLREVADGYARGELDRRAVVVGRDEIRDLANAFNGMAEAIEQRRKELEEFNRRLERRVELRTTELKAANDELESFSYAVSHDLRAPLRAVDGFSQALVEDYGEKLDGEARTYLGHLREGAQKMAHLIDDILKLSRATRGDLSLSDVDVSTKAWEILDRLSQSEPDRMKRFEIEPSILVYADPALIDVALENLLNNAWKFTSKSVLSVIEVGSEDTPEFDVIYIKDNGVGFDEQYAHKMFTPFQRLHSDEDFEGTGVGLSTVQRIVRKHGGDVWAESKGDAGAIFHFKLPKKEALAYEVREN